MPIAAGDGGKLDPLGEGGELKPKVGKGSLTCVLLEKGQGCFLQSR